MKTIRITDDLSATKGQVVRLHCDCGWEEKVFAGQEANRRCTTHARTQHGGNADLTYKGHTRRVRNSILI